VSRISRVPPSGALVRGRGDRHNALPAEQARGASIALHCMRLRRLVAGMNVRMRRLAASALLLLGALGFAAPATHAAAPSELCTTTGAGVIPITESCANRTYAEWSAAFWQYALGQPTTSNPLADPTGANCQVDQSGQVFFLAGTFDGSAVVRDCVVPAGKTLFFPVITIIDVSTPPGFCQRLPNLARSRYARPSRPTSSWRMSSPSKTAQ
jgi:hypothetical protein